MPSSPPSSEFRCTLCKSLLARQEPDQVSIRRGQFQAVITGIFSVAISCYRCRTVNSVQSSSHHETSFVPSSDVL